MASKRLPPARHGAALGIALASGLCGAALAHGLSAPDHAAAMDRDRMAQGTPDPASERPFLDGNAAAMDRMMASMAIAPSGDVDKDFVDMMVPHHQGAIDMAGLLLRYGNNQKLKYLAQEIIVTQQQEIAAMRLAVGEPLPASMASPTSLSPAPADRMPPQGDR